MVSKLQLLKNNNITVIYRGNTRWWHEPCPPLQSRVQTTWQHLGSKAPEEGLPTALLMSPEAVRSPSSTDPWPLARPGPVWTQVDLDGTLKRKSGGGGLMGPRKHKWILSPIWVLRDTDLVSKPQGCPVWGKNSCCPAHHASSSWGFIVSKRRKYT